MNISDKHKFGTYPMNTNRKMAAVIRAPLEAGDNIPSMANTVDGREKVG